MSSISRNQRQGKVVVRSLIAILLFSLCLGGGLLYLRNLDIEKQKAAKLERVKQAERLLLLDVKNNITLAEASISDSDLDGAKTHIRRASMLDTQAKLTAEINTVSLLYKSALKVHRRAEISKAFEESLERKKLKAAARAISNNAKYFTSEEMSQLELRIELRKQRLLDEELTHFNKALNSWELSTAEVTLDKIALYADKLETAKLTRNLKIRKQANQQAQTEAEHIQSLDKGEFSPELHQNLLTHLTQHPNHPQLLELKKRLEGYLLSVNIPGDFMSLDEALNVVPENCRIQLGDGTFFLRATINKSIELIGLGQDRTIIEGHTSPHPLLQITNKQGRVRISNLQIRGISPHDTQSQSLVLIDSEDVIFNKVHITNSSGHGVEVESGAIQFNNSKLDRNHEAGIAVYGPQSKVVAKYCEIQLNGGSGCDVWSGATIKIVDSIITSNAKSGVVLIGEGSMLDMKKSVITANTHSGLYLSKGASASIFDSTISTNAHSGIFAQWDTTSLRLNQVSILGNKEYGLLREPKVKVQSTKSQIKGNGLGEELLRQVR